MTASEIVTRPPAVLPSYLRAVWSALGRRGRADQTVPRAEMVLEGVSLRSARLERYRFVCGFGDDGIPLTWPQVLAFPLHMRLLTRPGFPFPLPGLVHVRNAIDSRAPLPVDAPVTIVARIGASRAVDAGVEFDLEAEVLHDGAVAWSACAVTLHRRRSGGRRRRPKDGLAYECEELRDVPADIGRRYARVSGDYNPIHLYAATARLLGFKKAIAHGMWTLATTLARVDTAGPDRPRRIDCAFKLPVTLPAQVRLMWSDEADPTRFRLEDAKRGRPHLTGTITPS